MPSEGYCGSENHCRQAQAPTRRIGQLEAGKQAFFGPTLPDIIYRRSNKYVVTHGITNWYNTPLASLYEKGQR